MKEELGRAVIVVSQLGGIMIDNIQSKQPPPTRVPGRKELVTIIQGRHHVKVPGWQYAGTKLDIIPVVEEVLELSTDKEICYQTRIVLLNIKTNQYVSCGHCHLL